MAIYNTYKEAVIAKGSTDGIYTDGEWFFTPKYYKTYQCNPADYLETLESFLASGKRLVDGDLYIEKPGNVVKVVSDDADSIYYGGDIPQSTANSPMKHDDRRFILQAAADQVETLEEKEAFDAMPNQTTIDAMTDTTPQRFEALSKTDWQHGDKCLYKGIPAVVVGWHPEHPVIIIDSDDFGLESCAIDELTNPETPAEREERERDELAKQIMIDLCGEDVFDKRDWNYHKKFTEAANQAFKLVDLGYRKE